MIAALLMVLSALPCMADDVGDKEMNGYDFSVFTNVSITGIDVSSLDEASLSLLYAQARDS